MKRLLSLILICLSTATFAQEQFGSAGLKIGGTSTYNWRLYRAGSGTLNQSLLFANVGGTANQETIRMRFTQWGGLSLGGTTINSTDMLSVNGDSRFAGNINLPLLSGGSGQIRFVGEATDYALIKAEPYGSGSGSRMRFQIGDNTDDYFSFFHSDHTFGAKEMMQVHRSQLWLKDSDLIIDNINNKGLQLRQDDANRFGNVFITQDVGTGSGTGNTMLFEVGNAYGTNHNQRMVFRSAGSDRMVIEHNGRIGIGTMTPNEMLQVNGNIRLNDYSIKSAGNSRIDFGNIGLGNENDDLGIYIHNDGEFEMNKNDLRMMNVSNNFNIAVSESVKVGIGTTNPTHKLSVNGTVRAKEILVEASPWPDYVFEGDYELMSLEEVKAFIEKEGHLPNVPSAAEVAENGLAVGEMNVKLMEKVEELTLYTIELQEKMKAQQAMIDTLIEKFENSTGK
ncbi:MAG: hypothetical protein WBA74_25585 [Cyclobacteriaceae bacterium]